MKSPVYLDDNDIEHLRRLAEKEGRTEAEVLHAAIAAYTSPSVADREFELLRSGRGDGRSAADIPEEELLEGFGS